MDDTLNATKQHDGLEHSPSETLSGSESANTLIADIFAHMETPDPAPRTADASKADDPDAVAKSSDVRTEATHTGKLARFAARKAPSSPAEPKIERETPENDAAYDLKSLLEKLPSSAAHGRVSRKSSEGVPKTLKEPEQNSDAPTSSEEAGTPKAPAETADTEPSSEDAPAASAPEKKTYAPTRKTLVSDGIPSAPAEESKPAEEEDTKAQDTNADGENADSETEKSDDEASDDSMYEEDDLRPATATPASEPMYDGRMLSQALVSSGRAFSHAVMNVGGTRKRAGRFWMIVIGMLILMALLVVLAHYKHREIKLGYELSNAISEREALLEENRKLRIELRVQSSRDRLEPMASRQLGLTQLRPEQILFIRQAEQPNTPPDPDPSQRSDGLDRVKLLEDK